MKNILNIAHRGFTKIFPDNTIEAFQGAIEIGVDGIECDVQETADRKFVISHDPDLFGTSIRKLSISQIENIKLQEKFKIPTLEETLDIIRKRVKLIIELKQVWSLAQFIKLLNSHAEIDDVVVASFRSDLLLEVLHLAPEVHRAVIIDQPIMELIRITESVQPHILIVKFPFLTAKLVDKVHAHNISIFVWGCISQGDIRDALKLNIDGVISDFPDFVSNEISKKT